VTDRAADQVAAGVGLDDWLDRFDIDWRPSLFGEFARSVPAGSDSRAALFELIKIDIEKRWQGGDRPRLEEYLAAHPEVGPASAVPPDVIRAETDARERYGDPVSADELHRRFPDQARSSSANSPPAATPPPTRGAAGTWCRGRSWAGTRWCAGSGAGRWGRCTSSATRR
jgi:hypothetical protein